jgi:uncharacterized protein
MKRLYETIITEHFANYEQMVFLAGPRQVGKTTIAKQFITTNNFAKYLNWDNPRERMQLLAGYEQIVENLAIDVTSLPQKPIVVFDELLKFRKWKNFLKGFIDEYKGRLDIIVTGSAKLNLLRRSTESLMGRYFLYRVHPLSVAEICRTTISSELILPPSKIDEDAFATLFKFGGFPEPFIKQKQQFHARWQNLRRQQLLFEDIQSLAQIQELAQLETLAILLQNQTGQLTNYSQLGKKIQVTDGTIRRWIKALESFYYCFTIKPWTKNITRSLLKIPKVYLWDWSIIEDKGARIENFVASHLLKAVHYWTDMGMGEFELFFLRDKEQHEADFLVTQNKKPWLIIEVKSSVTEPLSKNLKLFQAQTGAPHALQLSFDLPYSEQDCFQFNEPKIVSLKTFLSQLV